MLQATWQAIRRTHSRLRQTDDFYMVVVAMIIGLGGGGGAVLLRKLIAYGQMVGWWIKPTNGEAHIIGYLQTLPWWWLLAVPAAGGLICGLIIVWFAREAQGHGVPEVIEALALHGGRIRPRVVIAKLISSGIVIASGGSVGPEGPTVQVGSAWGSTLGQWLRLDERRVRTFVGCGAAAGIAASFNAPVAGAFFALEVILADFAITQFSPIVVSSVVATVVWRSFYGNGPVFAVDQEAYQVVHYSELLAYAVLGILAGFGTLLFVKSLYLFDDVLGKLRIWLPAKAALGGVCVGAIAVFGFPQVLGVGYEAMEEALAGQLAWWVLLALVFLKIIATSITLGSGSSGGIFAPSLFVGAMLGGVFGCGVNALWPGATADSGAYALVGMAAVIGAATHAPMTAIMIIFEMTTDYQMILPLMISTILATTIAMQLQKGSIFTEKLLRRGVELYRGRDVSVLRNLHVHDQMRTDYVTVPPNADLAEITAKFIQHPGASLMVVNEAQQVIGVIAADQSREILSDPQAYAGFIIARDLMQEGDFPTVRPDDTLADVLRHLAHYRAEIPVVASGQRLLGVIWPEDVIARYNAEVLKRDMASTLVSNLSRTPQQAPVPALEGTVMQDVPVPPVFIGKSLGSLDLRNRLGVSVLLIRQNSGDGDTCVNTMPAGDYVFQPGDVVLAMGPAERLRQFEFGDLGGPH